MRLSLVALSTVLSLTSAIEITSPAAETILSPYNFTITWTRNSTIDPAHINIVLTNADESGFGSRSIASDVIVNDFSYTLLPADFAALDAVANGSAYVININSVAAEGSAFVTQSEEFTIHNDYTGEPGAGGSEGTPLSTSSGSSSGTSSAPSSTSAVSSASTASSASAAATSSTLTSVSSARSSSVAATSATSPASSSASVAVSTGAAALAYGNMNIAGGLWGAAVVALLV